MIESKTLTLETKVWEGDWEFLLKTKRLKNLYESCKHSNLTKILYINNVKDISKVKYYAQKLVDCKTLDKFYVVDDYAHEALKFFELTPKDLGKGYVYSISELVSIYLTKTDYLLHFSSDTNIPFGYRNSPWLEKLIDTLENTPKIAVANLIWDYKFTEARNESIYEDEDFFFGYGFSDQMFLIRTTDFRKKIYQETHPASNRYPKYAGDLFEKRVDSWMRSKNLLRATYKKASYRHKNFPKNIFLKKIYFLFTSLIKC